MPDAPPATHPVQQPFPPERSPTPMLGTPGFPAHAIAASVQGAALALWDYVPAAVVAVVLLAFAVTLIVVATHQHRDS